MAEISLQQNLKKRIKEKVSKIFDEILRAQTFKILISLPNRVCVFPRFFFDIVLMATFCVGS